MFLNQINHLKCIHILFINIYYCSGASQRLSWVSVSCVFMSCCHSSSFHWPHKAFIELMTWGQGSHFPSIAACIKSILIQANTSLWTDAALWWLVLMNLGSYRSYNEHNLYNQNILKRWISLCFGHSKKYNLCNKALKWFSEHVFEVQSKIFSDLVCSYMIDWLIVCF